MKGICLRGLRNYVLIMDRVGNSDVFKVINRGNGETSFESTDYDEAMRRMIKLQEEIVTLTPPDGYHLVTLFVEGNYKVQRTTGMRRHQLVWVYIIRDCRNGKRSGESRSYDVICQKTHALATEEATACP